MIKRFLLLAAMLFWCNTSFAGCIEGDCNNGYGTFTWEDGRKYVGEFKNGRGYGQGTFTMADGYKYVGEWKNGLKHGQGTSTRANGDKYVGEFKDDKRSGQGTYTQASGKIYNGIWENNELVKTKKLTREDKNIAKAKNVCRKIGFTPGTDKFLDCTVKMLTTTGGQQTVIVGNQRKSIYPLHCRQMGGASAC